MAETKPTPDGFVDLHTARAFAGNPGVSTVYAWMAAKTFPRPYAIGANRRGWKIRELEAWRDSRPQAAYRTKEAT